MKITQEEISLFLDDIQQLTLDQYDNCKALVVQRVQNLIGPKPTRKELSRDEGQLLTPLDWIAFAVFIPAFIVSSVHIINHVGKMASTSFQSAQYTVGITFETWLYTVIHQVGFVFLAEASMLLFLVTWRMTLKPETKWYHFTPMTNLLLSVVAMIFVIVSNISSGLSPLEAVMPPIFTIGIGFHLEKIIVEFIRRRESLTKRLTEALDFWEKAQEDPSKHPEYRPLLVREIWEKLVRLKANRDYADVSPILKWSAVNREMERDTWAHDQVRVVEAVSDVSGNKEDLQQEDDGLKLLLQLVKKSSKNPSAKQEIDLPTHSANLINFTWVDKSKGKAYGPYKSYFNMIAGIAQAIKVRDNRNSLQDEDTDV